MCLTTGVVLIYATPYAVAMSEENDIDELKEVEKVKPEKELIKEHKNLSLLRMGSSILEKELIKEQQELESLKDGTRDILGKELIKE